MEVVDDSRGNELLEVRFVALDAVELRGHVTPPLHPIEIPTKRKKGE